MATWSLNAALLVDMSLPLVPALRLENEHSSVHAVAKATVDSAVRQAVHDVEQAVQNATQWLSQAVGHELLSQAVAVADQANASSDSSDDNTTRVETDCESSSGARGLPLPPIEPSNARIHAVAETTVDAVIHEALHDVTQAVESAAEWLTQAVRGELISHAVAEASVAVVSTEEPSTVGLEADETSFAPPEAAKALLSSDVHAVAEATVDAVVLEAVQSVTQAVEDATDWLTLAVSDELVSRAVADAASTAEADPTTDSNASSEAEREPCPSAGAASIQIPMLRLPHSAHDREQASTASLESSRRCLQLAQPFVAQAISSALQQTLAFQKTPVSEHTSKVASLQGNTSTDVPASASVVESAPPPAASLVGETAPPDAPPTSRRKSPNTRKRTLEVPKQSASVPPAVPSAAVETPATAPTHSILPPLILPGSQGTPRHGKVLHHPHKALHQPSPQSSRTAPPAGSPRGTSTSPTKPKAGLPLPGELELTPLSSARAAARIYAQQQPSARASRQQHKSKRRDSECQTSPPSSPPSSPPRRHRSHDPDGDGAINASRTKHHSHSKHSSSSHTLDNSTEQKAAGRKSTLLLPLASTQTAHPTAETTKVPSPSRVIKSRARVRKEGGAVVSPSKTRSGFCQRCVFEGRSCKVNDCLKHQLLK